MGKYDRYEAVKHFLPNGNRHGFEAYDLIFVKCSVAKNIPKRGEKCIIIAELDNGRVMLRVFGRKGGKCCTECLDFDNCKNPNFIAIQTIGVLIDRRNAGELSKKERRILRNAIVSYLDIGKSNVGGDEHDTDWIPMESWRNQEEDRYQVEKRREDEMRHHERQYQEAERRADISFRQSHGG